MSYTVTKENDFGYPIGESIDDEIIDEFERFVDNCSINFNDIYFGVLDHFEQFGHWWLFNGERCYDEPTFESVRDDYKNDFFMMWE